jgi:hypothetical protein
MSTDDSPNRIVTIVTRQPRIPSDWALAAAIERLRSAAGYDRAAACHAVADWLEAITGLRERRP